MATHAQITKNLADVTGAWETLRKLLSGHMPGRLTQIYNNINAASSRRNY